MGILIISLDFELYWGMHDVVKLEDYKRTLRGARATIPEILELFKTHKVHATWAVVGMLFHTSKRQLHAWRPLKIPYYEQKKLSSYRLLPEVGKGETDDPFHFAPSLIDLIRTYSHQEIGSHTYSHYYCLERGQDIHNFALDISTAVAVARERDLTLRSIVFPRNQIREEYLKVLASEGIISYRGNQSSWMYRDGSRGRSRPWKRLARLLDAYIPLSSHNDYSPNCAAERYPFNLPASRFLRPHIPALKVFDNWRLKRIKSEMSHAAKQGLIYHLWWHPHNFGMHSRRNIQFLQAILEHYENLHRDYGMQSMNMTEVSEQLLLKRGIHCAKS